MQQSKPMVSIIIPVYKVEAYLEQCLVSVIHQSYTNLEILLIDDGSPDNCPQMCDLWACRDSRIRVIHKSNGGLSDARNAGLSHAHGELVAFVDSDDWIALDMIEKMVDAMLRNQADMVICQYTVVYADGRMEKGAPGDGAETIMNCQEALAELLNDYQITNHVWRKLYWRNKIPKDVFPKGHNFEDIYVMPALFTPCKKFVYITNPLYFYRCNENGIVQSRRLVDLRDLLMAQEYANKLIVKLYPSLKEQVRICNINRLINLWINSSDVVATKAEKIFFRRQLSEKLKYINTSDIRELGKRKKIAVFLVQYCPESVKLYMKVFGDGNSYTSKIKRVLKVYHQFIELKKRLKTKKTPKFVVICVPGYGNLGDQALLKGERLFVKQYFPEYQLVSISLDEMEVVRFIKNTINSNDIVALQAGGNIGTLYPGIHNIQESAMKVFRNKNMIIFPQTFYYSDDEEGQLALKETNDVYSRFVNFKIFVRDDASERLVREQFPKINVSLMPDMVLMNRPKISPKERNGVLICLRGDSEMTFPIEQRDCLLTEIEKYFTNIQQTDTHIYYDPKNSEEVQILLDKFWNQIAQKELIITDRLHGMIFALLTGTPCVTILSKSPKVEGVYNAWLKDNASIKIIHSVDEICNAIKDVLPHHDEPLNLDKTEMAYNEMAQEIREIAKGK